MYMYVFIFTAIVSIYLLLFIETELAIIEAFSNKNCSGSGATVLAITALETCTSVSGTNQSYFGTYESVPAVSGFIFDAYYSTSSCSGSPFAVNAYYAGDCLQYSTGYAILQIVSLATCSQYTVQMYTDSACTIPVGPVTTHFMSELGLSNSPGCTKNTNFYSYGYGKMSCSATNPVGLVPYPRVEKK